MVVSYDAMLVVLSISVAIIGSFTGLMITSSLSLLTGTPYKLQIVAGALAIGCSIWSMHFISMLALSAPVPLDYDGLKTTISAFVAICLTGLGLYAASSGHFGRPALLVGGMLMGGGIAGMHYMGMSAIRAACTASYEPVGVAASILAGIAASTLALSFAFREHGPLETALGAVVLGLAISAMHYTAMLATIFSPSGDTVAVSGPVLSQHGVAFIVAIATFLICGLFLIIALPDKKPRPGQNRTVSPGPVGCEPDHPAVIAAETVPPALIPVRRNQSIYFAVPGSILAIRAEGHYSWIALRSKDGGVEEHFCEKPISDLAKLLAAERFMRTHRSHLVNIDYVAGFRRQGDGAILLMDEEGSVSVPVSRANVHLILRQLEGRIANGMVALEHAPA
jgi:NO-binding membrane sensor protein with MHYT domain